MIFTALTYILSTTIVFALAPVVIAALMLWIGWVAEFCFSHLNKIDLLDDKKLK